LLPLIHKALLSARRRRILHCAGEKLRIAGELLSLRAAI
jgi:hypothetical protein